MPEPTFLPIKQLGRASALSGADALALGQGVADLKQVSLDDLRSWILALFTPPANGEHGRTLLNGSGAPVAALGEDGDFYIDPTALVIYGPKADGTWPAGLAIGNGRSVPITPTRSGGYTLALSDAGQTVPITAGNVLIPANAAVQFPIESVLQIENRAGAPINISITADTLVFAADGTTGPRTLRSEGIACLYKVSATKWKIFGAGLV